MGPPHRKKVCHNNNHLYIKPPPGGSPGSQGGRTSPTHSHCSSTSFSSLGSTSEEKRSTALLDRKRVVYTALFLVCTAVYWNSLSCQFVFDDITAIVENRDLRPHVPLRNLLTNDFWGTPMIKEQSHKSYRPLTVLSFRLNYLWGELEPVGYHLVNLVCHGLVTMLYFHTCRQVMSASALTSLVASLLFAVHPVSLVLLLMLISMFGALRGIGSHHNLILLLLLLTLDHYESNALLLSLSYSSIHFLAYAYSHCDPDGDRDRPEKRDTHYPFLVSFVGILDSADTET